MVQAPLRAVAFVALLVVTVLTQDTTIPCVSSDFPARPSDFADFITTSQCNHASRDFQRVLKGIQNVNPNITLFNLSLSGQSAAQIANYSLNPEPMLTPMNSVIVNKLRDSLFMDRCRVIGEAIPSIVAEGASTEAYDNRNNSAEYYATGSPKWMSARICCRTDHLLSDAEMSRMYVLTSLVLQRIDSFLMVLFTPNGKIVVGPESHSCPVSRLNQVINFEDNKNFGVILSSAPFPDTFVWRRAVVYAIPCAWDVNGRPILVQLNFNPLAIKGIKSSNDEGLMQEIQHQLLHALGYSFSNESNATTVVSVDGLGRNVTYLDLTTSMGKSAYGRSAQGAIWPTGAGGCQRKETLLPLDEEIRIAAINQTSGTLSHLEGRVVRADAMTNGGLYGSGIQHTWKLSTLTRELFRMFVFPKMGLWAKSSPAYLLNVESLLADNTTEPYLASQSLQQNMTRLELLRVMRPPPVDYASPLPVFGGGIVSFDCESALRLNCTSLPPSAQNSLFCKPAQVSASTVPRMLFTQTCSVDRLAAVDCNPLMQRWNSSGTVLDVAKASDVFPIPASQRYFPEDGTTRIMDGTSVGADFCPLMPLNPVTALNCSLVSNINSTDSTFRGSIFGATSRCFESSVTLTGLRPGETPDVRCFALRCPFGIRVEFQMFNSSAWISCPLTGAAGVVDVSGFDPRYTGSVVCPPPEVICGAPSNWGVVLDPNKIAFRNISGYSIEFALLNDDSLNFGDTLQTQSQAAQLCSSIPQASLAFLPDEGFAAALMSAQTRSTFAVRDYLWVGATSMSSWMSMNSRYTMSSVNVQFASAIPPTGCFALDVASFQANGSVILAERDCMQRYPSACTRSWRTPPMYLQCPAGTRCAPTSSLSNVSTHRLYFVPQDSSADNNTYFTASAAESICSSVFSDANLFSLDNLTSTGPPLTEPVDWSPWYQTLLASTTTFGPGLLGLWTKLKWQSSAPLPPWKSLVRNWPSAPSGGYCFLLVDPSVPFRPLFATRDCNATFPPLCFLQNSLVPVPLPGYAFQLYFNRVPVPAAATPTACASQGKGSFVSPLLDERLLRVSRRWLSLLFGDSSPAATSQYLIPSDRASLPQLHSGAQVDFTGSQRRTAFVGLVNQTLWSSDSALLSSNPGTTNATQYFRPNETTIQSLTFLVAPDNIVTLLPTQSSSFRLYGVVPSSTAVAYICAVPRYSQWNASFSNFSDVDAAVIEKTDSSFSLFGNRSIASHDVAVSSCLNVSSREAKPLLFPTSTTAQRSNFQRTVVSIASLFATVLSRSGVDYPLFWTGLVYRSGVGVTSLNKTVSLDASIIVTDDLLQDGTCLAGYIASRTTNSSKNGVPGYWSNTTRYLALVPVDCNQQLMFFCRYPLAPSVEFKAWGPTIGPSPMSSYEFAVFNTTVDYFTARRVCVGLESDLWILPSIDDTIPNIAQAKGIITQLNGPFWSCFSSRSSSVARTARNTQGLFDRTFVDTSESAFFSINATILQENASSLRMYICMRPVGSLVYRAPLPVTFQSKYRNSVDVSANVGTSERVEVLLLVNTSIVDGMEFPTVRSIQTPIAASAPETLSFFVECTNRPFLPVWLSAFTVTVPKVFTFLAFQAPSISMNQGAPLFPCKFIELSRSASGPFEMSPVSYSTTDASLVLYIRLAVQSDDPITVNLSSTNCTLDKSVVALTRDSQSTGWDGYSSVATKIVVTLTSVATAARVAWQSGDEGGLATLISRTDTSMTMSSVTAVAGTSVTVSISIPVQPPSPMVVALLTDNTIARIFPSEITFSGAILSMQVLIVMPSAATVQVIAAVGNANSSLGTVPFAPSVPSTVPQSLDGISPLRTLLFPGEVLTITLTPKQIAVPDLCTNPDGMFGVTKGFGIINLTILNNLTAFSMLINSSSQSSLVTRETKVALQPNCNQIMLSLFVVVRQALRVLAAPTFFTSGVPGAPFVLWLAQYPLNTTTVALCCSYSSLNGTCSTTTFDVRNDTSLPPEGVNRSITITIPDAITDNPLSPNTTWICAFAVSGSFDVASSVAAVAIPVLKRGTSVSQLPNSIRPNRTYTFTVTLEGYRVFGMGASVLNWSLPSGAVVAYAVRNTTSTYLTKLVTVISMEMVTLPTLPTNTPIVVDLQLSDTLWFRNPPIKTIEVYPLIAVTAAEPPATFLMAQPMGASNAQSLTLQLNIFPREASIAATCYTVPRTDNLGRQLVSFDPSVALWPMSASVGNASQTAKMIQMTGLVPDVLFRVYCDIQSPAGELAGGSGMNTTLSLLNGGQMLIVPLLLFTIALESFNGVLFVGAENSKTMYLRLSTLPQHPVTIVLQASCGVAGVTNCLSMVPSQVTFLPWSNSSLVVAVNVTGLVDTSSTEALDAPFINLKYYRNSTILALIRQPVPVNLDTSSSVFSVAFPVLPKIVTSIIDAVTGQKLTSVTVFCGGLDTPTKVLINVTSLPVDPTAAAVISMDYGATANMSRESLVYTMPETLQFSKYLSSTLSTVWTFLCPSHYFASYFPNSTQQTISAVVTVNAPTEFVSPGPSLSLKLLRLLGASVSISSQQITVGSVTTTLLVTPEQLPEAGRQLVVRFVTTCPNAISLQYGNELIWSPGMPDSQQALRVITTSAAGTCVIALQLAENSTARNYLPTLNSTTVTIFPPSQVIWLATLSTIAVGGDTIPVVVSDDIRFGNATLVALVTMSNSFRVFPQIVPFPLYDVTSFSNASAFGEYVGSLSNTTTRNAFYMYSDFSESSKSGFLSLLKSNFSAVTCVAAQNSLIIFLSDPTGGSYRPQQDERITLLFSQYALTRNDAPLDPSGTNISFYISASADPLAQRRGTTFSAAFLFAAGASFTSGPSLATKAIHQSVILDLMACPNTNWRTQKQGSNSGLPAVFNPISANIGSINNLGWYFTGVVFGVGLIVVFVLLHIIAMFLVYARRLEYRTKTDAATGVAMATLRFPSLECFPSWYACGIVVHCGLKVAFYTEDNTLRVIAAICAVLAGVGIPLVFGWLISRGSPAEYVEFDIRNSASYCRDVLFRGEGEWITSSFVTTITDSVRRGSLERYLSKYGMLFEDLVGVHGELPTDAEINSLALQLKRKIAQNSGENADIRPTRSVRGTLSKYWFMYDLVHSIAVSGVSVYEPADLTSCATEAEILVALFAVQLVALCVFRPFRYAVVNFWMILLAATELVASIGSLLPLLKSVDSITASEIVNITFIVEASLIFCKVLYDVLLALGRSVRHMASKGYIAGGSGPTGLLFSMFCDGDEQAHNGNTIQIAEDVPMEEMLEGYVSPKALQLLNMEQRPNPNITTRPRNFSFGNSRPQVATHVELPSEPMSSRIDHLL